MAPKDSFFVFNAKGNVKKNYSNVNTFKNEIIKLDIFIENCFHFNKYINQIQMYMEIESILKNQKNLILISFLQRPTKEWLWPKFTLYFKKKSKI